MKVVLDTNVLLVAISNRSSFHWIYKNFIDEKYSLCVTTDILDEYAEIFEQHLGLIATEDFFQVIENAINLEQTTKHFKWNLISIDPDDNKFVDCAINANANFLVTEDKHFKVLLQVSFPKVKVIGIEEFKKMF